MNSDRTIRILLAAIAAAISAQAGDARNGALVAEKQGCLECHTVGGQGAGHEPPLGTGARDLTDSLTPAYTPAALASAVWNHTPGMWEETAKRHAGIPAATAAEWEDVFAWLYSLQFSEKPAEVGRGKLVFEGKECSACHSLAAPAKGPGKPVSLWERTGDPVVLVYQLWNHSSTMGKEFAAQTRPWPIMTGRDFMDLTAYLQHTQKLLPEREFSLPEASTGRLPFAINCGKCHSGPMSLENRASNQTWMDLGAGMWNHVPLMVPSPPPLAQAEMRQILAWVWEVQYQGPRGHAEAGRRVFEDSGCESCHRSPANLAPARPRSRPEIITPWSLASVGWGPARSMHQQMLGKGLAWPKLSPDNMNDLVAYLNSLPR